MNELDEFLSKYKLFSALKEVAKLSRQLFDKNKVRYDFTLESNTSKQTVTQWGLFFIAHRLILCSNDEQLSNFEYDNLLEANSIFNELDEPFFEDGDLLGWLVRSSQQQFWFQEYFAYKFARNYLILVELYDKFQDKIKVNIKEVFHENWNLTIRDFLMIGFSIFKLSLHNNFLLLDPLYLFLEQLEQRKILELDEVLTIEKFNNFIDIVSASYDQIRDLHNEFNKSTLTGFEQYEFNPLSQYPLVKCSVKYDSEFQKDENYLVPTNVIALFKKFTDIAYWQLRNRYSDLKSRDFLQSFGDLFEIYVGEILRRYFGEDATINLNDYLGSKTNNKKQPKIADWLINVGDSIFIFECKSKLMSIALKKTFDRKLFNNWLDDTFVAGAEQLESTIQLLQKDNNYSGKQFFKFMVLNEDFYFAENPIFKEFILSYIKEELKKRNSNVEENSNFDSSNFYIITIRELELLEVPIEKFGIHRIMAEKENIDKKNQPDEGYNFIDACKNIDKDLEFKNSWLVETCSKFFNERNF